MKCNFRIIVLNSFISLLIPYPSYAWEFSQHLKYNHINTHYPDHALAAISYANPQRFNNINYRLNSNETIGSFDMQIHYELAAVNSQTNTLSPVEFDSTRLFDLSHTLSHDSNHLISHRLDRLSINYSTQRAMIRLGRHAVTWGNGLIFNSMDMFNPFSPTAIDKEYKTGDDMLYIQYVNSNGNDWQFIVLPRRNDKQNINIDHSSIAAKHHMTLLNTDWDILFARHYNDSVIGIGSNHSIGESIWRWDLVATRTNKAQSGAINSQLAKTVYRINTNIDYSWTTYGKNIYGFIELYRNGFGNKNSIDLNNVELMQKIDRGEIFTLFRNYLSYGFNIELHPLLNLSPTFIHNLHDQSFLSLISLSYSWKQNIDIKASLSITQGASDSEYGGANTPGDSFNTLFTYYF